jgi:hypothetical protein
MNNIINSIVEKISKNYPDLIIDVTQETKNNGIILNAIIIREKAYGIAPIIYIDDFINWGWSIDHIADVVYELYFKNKKDDHSEQLIKIISNYEIVKEWLSLQLVNYEKNIKLFETLPYKSFLDLGVYVVIKLPIDEPGEATIKITNEILMLWEKSFDEAYEMAMKNLHNETPVCTSLHKFMEERGVTVSYNIADDFYIITNSSGVYGASVMLNYDFINELAEKIGSDLIVFPSSVDEILALSMNDMDDLSGLSDIVKSVNAAEIDEQKILSDHIYLFRRGQNWEF